MWRLNKQCATKQTIKGEIQKKFPEINENGNTKTQNLWDVAKAVLRGKFIMIQAYLKNKRYLK